MRKYYIVLRSCIFYAFLPQLIYIFFLSFPFLYIVDDPWGSTTGLPPGSSEMDYSLETKYEGHYYSLNKNPYRLYTPEFRRISDHTFPNDTTRGYMMFVDPGVGDYGTVLYQTEIPDLCNEMELSFSAWFISVNTLNPANGNVKSPKIELQIVNKNDTTDIYTNTDILEIPYMEDWKQLGFQFKLPADAENVLFRIINREPSKAGNDWAMDDVTIRFCSPPVTTPFSIFPDSIDECENSPFTLAGYYTDDGTFGDDISYRWEYSSTGDILNSAGWTVVSGSQGTSATGEVVSVFTIDSFSLNHAGYYRLVVGKTENIDSWPCRAASDVIHLTLKKQPDAGSIRALSTICTGAKISMNNTVSGGVWTSSDSNIASVNSSGEVTGISEGQVTITYTVTQNGCTNSATGIVIVGESAVIWTPEANADGTNEQKQDWNIEANAASDSLKRERCYMLSSPLRNVVTGDLSFDGFPLTFLMKFGPVEKDNTNYEVGNWTTPYTSLVEPVGNSTDGFAFYMYGYNPSGSEAYNKGCTEFGSYNDLNDLTYLSARTDLDYGIQETNGILELPFFEDEANMYADRTQEYSSSDRKSTFYAINDGVNNPENFNKLTGTSVTLSRDANNGNYRFIPETANGNTWTFQTTVYHSGSGLGGDDEFLVGNPYMSSIDMAAFLNDNASTILPQYRI